MPTQPHFQTFIMAREAQLLGLAWLEPDAVRLLSRVCDVLLAIPRCEADEDRVVLAVIVRHIADAFVHAQQSRDLSVEVRLRRSKVADVHIARALAFICRDFATPSLGLRSVADRCRVSTPYLSHLISLNTGHGFHTYLTAMRLLHAVFLLTTTPLAIEEIADKCGWRSTASLDHAFKRWFFMTPGEFRRWGT